MAGTIVTRLNITVENGGFVFSPPELTSNVAQAAQGGGNPGYLEATTSEADVSFGGLVSPGRVLLINLHDTGKLQYGPKSGGSMVQLGELEPGDFDWITIDTGVTLRYRSDTGTVPFMCHGFKK